MKGIKFKVYNNGFLVHSGFKSKNAFHGRKDEENERNKILYRMMKAEMLLDHPTSQRRC